MSSGSSAQPPSTRYGASQAARVRTPPATLPCHCPMEVSSAFDDSGPHRQDRRGSVRRRHESLRPTPPPRPSARTARLGSVSPSHRCQARTLQLRRSPPPRQAAEVVLGAAWRRRRAPRPELWRDRRSGWQAAVPRVESSFESFRSSCGRQSARVICRRHQWQKRPDSPGLRGPSWRLPSGTQKTPPVNRTRDLSLKHALGGRRGQGRKTCGNPSLGKPHGRRRHRPTGAPNRSPNMRLYLQNAAKHFGQSAMPRSERGTASPRAATQASGAV